MKYITKNNILLTEVAAEHLFKMKELKDETWMDTNNTTIVNIDDQIRWLNRLQVDPTRLYLIALYKIDDTFKEVGVIKIDKIDHINRSCSIGRDIFPEYRDRLGHALYGFSILLPQASIEVAFDLLNLNRIECEILETNRLALKCAKIIGMTKEAVKREAAYKNGQWINSICYSILKNER